MLLTNSTHGYFGYSIVAKRVCQYLRQQGHDCIIFGLQTIGRVIEDELSNKNIPLFFHPWGADALGHYLKAHKTDILISILDLFQPGIEYLPRTVKEQKVVWAAHITTNHMPLSPFLVGPIKEADVAIVPSKFGLQVLREAGFTGPDIFQISHGVDTKFFSPLSGEEREEIRRKLGVLDKSTILLCVARNKGGVKNYPDLFKAWKLALGNIPNLKKEGILLVLSYPEEPEGVRIDHLRNLMGLQNHVKFIWAKPTSDWSSVEPTYEGDANGFPHQPNWGFDEKNMRKIYGLADCMIFSTQAESFCFPVIESAAMGIPSIAPNHTVFPELIGEPKAGLLADIKMATTIPLLSDIFNVDPISLAGCIAQLYEDENLRKELGKNALENTRQYGWDRILPRWAEVVERFGVPPCDYSKGTLGV